MKGVPLALLLLGLLFFGCLNGPEEKQSVFNGTSLSIELRETNAAGSTQFVLQNKTLTTVSKFGKVSREISFVQLLALARSINESGYFNATPSEKCTECPEYDLKVRLMEKERFEKYRTYRLTRQAQDILSALRTLSEVPECRIDSDCVTDGCSGQFCRPYREPGRITTCEFRPEYACYKPSGCGCSQGTCSWSPDTLACVQKATQAENAKTLPEEIVQTLCVRECFQQLSDGKDLRSGPCISDAIAAGWACDVIHEPRQSLDDSATFLCPSLASGKTYHVVELDATCGVLNVR